MAASRLALSPREYDGDPATCVYGRVVMVRGPVVVGSQEAAQSKGKSKTKAKGSGKSKDKGLAQKIEVHLLGGDTVGDVLFLDAWRDTAEQVRRAMELGKVYRVSGGSVVRQSPKYSTSRLPYFLRVVPPLGTKTVIQECTASPWADVPSHHPFADIGSLGKVSDSLQVCAIGVISHQPGILERDTQYGRSGVCDAEIKQGLHDIRCACWRDRAANVAASPVGAAVALMQVTVRQRQGSWEIFATEATQVMACPADLAESVRAATDASASADPATSLTRRHAVDYDKVPTIVCTVSGLMSVPVPLQKRDLPGVFDIHCVADTGVAGATADSPWMLNSCVECKKIFQRGKMCATPTPRQELKCGGF